MTEAVLDRDTLSYLTRLEDRLAQAQTVDDYMAVIDETARNLGFEYFTYLGGRLLMGAKMLGWDPKIRPLHLTSIPEEFRAMYSARRFDAIDPVFKYAAGAIRSTFWSHVYRLNDVSGPAREFVGLSHDFGLNEGIVAPVHGPGGSFGVVSFASRRKTVGPEAVMVQAMASLFAMHFHEAIRHKLIQMPPPPEKNLSERELDVLLWTAEGKSAWEIGQILSISEATVNFHLGSIKRKLGVVSKTQAVARLFTLETPELF